MRDLDRDVSNILAPFGSSFNPSAEPATACALLVNHLCMRRNKRCLLAYHKVRAEKLESYCWDGVDVLEQSGAGEGGIAGGREQGKKGEESSLSPEEEEYVRQYSDLLAAYKGQWTDIDLTGSLEPPKDLFIDVRVLKDAGEIQTEYGYVTGLNCEWHKYFTTNQCTQVHYSYQKQPVLRSAWRCRAPDRARVPPALKLRWMKGKLLHSIKLHHQQSPVSNTVSRRVPHHDRTALKTPLFD